MNDVMEALDLSGKLMEASFIRLRISLQRDVPACATYDLFVPLVGASA